MSSGNDGAAGGNEAHNDDGDAGIVGDVERMLLSCRLLCRRN